MVSVAQPPRHYHVSFAATMNFAVAEKRDLQLVSLEDTVSASGPSSLLLTTTPIANFQEEVHHLIEMGQAFQKVNFMICRQLRRDVKFDQLRESFQPFLSAMHLAIQALDQAFNLAREFYSNQWDDFLSNTWGQQITDEQVKKMLDPKRQVLIICDALELTKQCKAAIHHLETAIPLLPRLETELGIVVEEYLERYRIDEQRNQSLWPSIVWDAIQGKYDPPLAFIPIEDMEELPQSFEKGSLYLMNGKESKFIDFVKRLHIHFTCLYELSKERDSLGNLGYSTMEDFRRLCKQRLMCIPYIVAMQKDWFMWRVAFQYGRPNWGLGIY